MLELKITGAAQQTVDAVREAGFRNPVIYSLLPARRVKTCSNGRSRGLSHGALRRPVRASVSRAMKFGASYVGLRHDKVTRALVGSFHRAGLLVFVYTADALSDIQHALSLDVDGVISNFPDRIARPHDS